MMEEQAKKEALFNECLEQKCSCDFECADACVADDQMKTDEAPYDEEMAGDAASNGDEWNNVGGKGGKGGMDEFFDWSEDKDRIIMTGADGSKLYIEMGATKIATSLVAATVAALTLY